MVVVTIIGILTGLALAYGGEPRAGVRPFAEQIVGEADSTRLRALSTRRWHRMRIDAEAGKIVVEQATYAGMIVPDDDEWQVASTLTIPRVVVVASVATTANVVEGDGVPDEGDGLELVIPFSPDGASEPRTIYLRSGDGRKLVRVVVYRATGSAYVKEGW